MSRKSSLAVLIIKNKIIITKQALTLVMNTTGVQQQSEEARGKFIHQHVTLERNYALNVSPDSLTQKDRVIAEIRTCLSSSQNPKETLITKMVMKQQSNYQLRLLIHPSIL